jgi:ceramide glucosyltransferase
VGAPPPGRTGKLNAMIVGSRMADGELIAFGDSDTRPDRDVLRVAVETLVTTPRAGCAFAPVVVPGPARTPGDVLYALLINSLYGPSVALAADPDGAVPFIMGQLMVLKRQALADIGGVACAQGQLVDDMYIGARLAAVGWRNIVSPHPLHIVTGGMSVRQFARLFRRWLLFSRNGLPFAFTWHQWTRGVEFWLALLTALIGLGGPHAGAALLPAAAMGGFVASLASLQHEFGGERLRPRHRALPLALFLLAPAIAAATVLYRTVDWRGRAYSLDSQARLA